MNYGLNQSLAGCSVETKQGVIESALQELTDRTLYTRELVDRLYRLVEVDRPKMECVELPKVGGAIETVSQKLRFIDSIVVGENERLESLIKLLREQLGNEKLI